MRFMLRSLRPISGMASVGLLLSVAGCNSKATNSTPVTPVTLSFTLGSPSVVVPQDGTAADLLIAIAGPAGTPTVITSGFPAGVTEQYAPLDGGPSGTLTFTGSPSVPAGTFTPSITVSLAGQTKTKSFTLISAVVVKIGDTVDTTLGVSGVLQQFMSTSLQIAEWTGDFFVTGATATTRENMLTALGPQHVRLQAVSQAIPMVGHSGASTDWDFTMLDQTVQPVLAVADQSPEFQIAAAPAWMCDSNGHLDLTNHLEDFATYAANLVSYYNKGGFNWGGAHFQSASSQPITWWGIFNEYNINGLTASDYVKLYNTVVPAMLAVDPTIKFSALELSDYGLGTGESGDPELFLPVFLAPATAGGVKAQVNVLSTHLYGTCNQQDTDATLFAAVPAFAANVRYFYQELQTRPDLADVPVWVTENNVNADSADANGMSSCNPSQTYVPDPRGTSAFFAAWRPYVFSQLGKAGNRGLFHWQYTEDAEDDPQYGEVDVNSNPYLSYWVDRALATTFPSTTASPGPQILTLTSTDTAYLEMLATLKSDGTLVVMIVDRAYRTASDNNGSGDPRTVVVDLSKWSVFSAASLLTLDSTTNLATGPAGAGYTPASRMNITLQGYGVAFLTLTP
jgi:hypothetical protein